MAKPKGKKSCRSHGSREVRKLPSRVKRDVLPSRSSAMAENQKPPKKTRTKKQKNTPPSSDQKHISSSSKLPGSRGQSQSCHQCRQSIHSSKGVSEVKSGKERLKCSTCTRFWCEQCLLNRYGLVKDTVDPASWSCPVCCGKCNCSLCRKKEGKLATGILTPLAKNAGFKSVLDFLDKGTDDIAKVLQWKSPSPILPPSGEKLKDPPSVGAKRTHKKASTPSSQDHYGNSTDHCGNGSIRQSNEHVYHGNSGTKKRKLDHSVYNITMEEEEGNKLSNRVEDTESDCYGNGTSLEELEPNRLGNDKEPEPDSELESDYHGNGTELEPDDLHQDGNGTEMEPELHQNGNKMKPEPDFHQNGNGMEPEPDLYQNGTPLKESESDTFFSPPESQNPTHQSLLIPHRRSSRKRKAVVRYSSSDFNFQSSFERSRSSDDDDDDVEDNEFTVRVKSKSPPERSEEETTLESSYLEQQEKLKELSALRESQFNSIKSVKMMKKKEESEKRAREKAEARAGREEARKKELEERAKLREQQRLHQIAAQEKVKLARTLLKEAQRDLQRRQREKEKTNKLNQLQKLKEEKIRAKKRIQQLTSLPLTGGKESVPLHDDSPEACQLSGIPPLPTLPPLSFPVSPSLVPTFLFVSEFLYTFHEPLGLKKRMSATRFLQSLKGGRELNEVYKRLLKLIVVESSEVRKELDIPKKQKDLEKFAMLYLEQNGRNGFITENNGKKSDSEKSLVVLNHLCHVLLETGCLDEVMEDARLRVDQCQREQRTSEREKGREISEELKRMCEGGVASLDQVEARRKEFVSELEELRMTARMERYKCSLLLRNSSLGRDRHGRTYWKMQSVSGVVVEEPCGNPVVGEDRIKESCKSGVSEWFIIDKLELLQSFIECLHPQGRNEKRLLNSLTFYKENMDP